MKVTSSQLKKIIIEEVEKCLNEWDYYSPDGNYEESLPSYNPYLVYKDEINDYLEGKLPKYDKKTFAEYINKMDALEQKNVKLYDDLSDLLSEKIEVELYDFDGDECSNIDIYISPKFKQFLETEFKQQEPEFYKFLVTQVFNEDTIKEVYCIHVEETEDGRYVPDGPEYDRDNDW